MMAYALRKPVFHHARYVRSRISPVDEDFFRLSDTDASSLRPSARSGFRSAVDGRHERAPPRCRPDSLSAGAVRKRCGFRASPLKIPSSIRRRGACHRSPSTHVMASQLPAAPLPDDGRDARSKERMGPTERIEAGDFNCCIRRFAPLFFFAIRFSYCVSTDDRAPLDTLGERR